MIEFRKIYDRLTAEVKTANDGKTAITILPTEYAEQVLEMMKRMEPMRVNNIAQQISCFSGICQSCGKMLNTTCNKNYCGECGQAVKWDQE